MQPRTENRRPPAASRFARRASGTLLLLLLLPAAAVAQGLRFHNHRDIAPPDYVTLRLGPFYSTVLLYIEAGWRYTESRGTGTDFLHENRRGRIQTDGHDFPIVGSLIFRNYLIVTPTTDLDVSVRVTYEHYPLKTQEDEFRVDLAEEGVFASISSEFALTPFIKGRLYDDAAYRTDFIDTRGLEDPYGGARYEHFQNRLGADLDWLLSERQDVSLRGSRTDLIPFSDEFSDQERVTYDESAGYEWELVPGATVGAWASFSQTDYAATNRPRVDTEEYLLRVDLGRGTAIPLTRSTVLFVGVGYSQGHSYHAGDTGRTDVATLVGLAGLKTQLTRKLSHSLSFSRSLVTDFNYPLATVDLYRYQVDFGGEWVKAGAFTQWRIVDPARDEWLGYRDWDSGLRAEVPITPYVRLRGDTVYSVRWNAPLPDARDTRATPEGAAPRELAADLAPDPEIDAEWRSDYITWASSASLLVALTRELDLEAYAQYIRRTSEERKLAFEREIYGVRLVYAHEF
ncbi:MAG: hypothetical protein FJ225_01040 [Lentisphaerae bacterium]|nr:hypothetical protein [Lentisphaerota bacterium]